MCGPGRGQYRVGIFGRHGRLRHDRPIGHQREVRRARPTLGPGSWRDLADHGGVSWTMGSKDPDGRASRSHDHGRHRNVQLGFDS